MGVVQHLKVNSQNWKTQRDFAKKGQNFRVKIPSLDTKWNVSWRPPALQSPWTDELAVLCPVKEIQAQGDFLGCLWELQSEADSAGVIYIQWSPWLGLIKVEHPQKEVLGF